MVEKSQSPDDKLEELFRQQLPVKPRHNVQLPTAVELAAASRVYGADALMTLVDLMHGADSDKIKKAAADAILDRGFGKPNQDLTLAGKAGQPLELVVNRVIVQPQTRELEDE